MVETDNPLSILLCVQLEIPFEKQVKMDLDYIANQSFWFESVFC